MTLHRRDFLQLAATLGASLAWGSTGCQSSTSWRERRDLYPEGVASGDPDPHSVILWTRRPFDEGDKYALTVEVAEDEAFQRVIANAPAVVSAASDWTTRVLVAGLQPARVYWYRFTDADGNGSRIGRTITAPAADDPRPIHFAFVSCQSLNEGKLNAYRRMIFEDKRAAPADQLGFVLHLGDFIYEVVSYPDEVKTRLGRIIYDVGRIPGGHKVGNFHIPLTVDGYRAIYKGYLRDPDLQDARARWPFVAIWDNHEFSWQGYQSFVRAGSFEEARPSVKIAANQAWFEYLPSRVAAPSGSLAEFGPPAVKDVKIEKFDDNGLGIEPNNLVAINSLKVYRALRYGKHLDLIITDQYSYRAPDGYSDPSLGELGDWGDYNGMFPEDVMKVLDAGRTFNGGNPPAEIQFGAKRLPNPQKNASPQTLLGAEQKAWLKNQLTRATATWKIWASSLGTMEWRADLENLPPGMTKTPWPAGTYANMGSVDHGAMWTERREIFDVVRDAKIAGFAIVAGDRHSFWAGYAAADLPPGNFEPVGLSFVGASLISPGAGEGSERMPKKAPLRPLYVVDRAFGERPDLTLNLLLKHGVRSCLEYAKSFDLERARAVSNPAMSPHLAFIDMAAHGYATVRLDDSEMRTELVCIPRPIYRSEREDGGPLRYRIAFTAKLWRAGEKPQLEQTVLEGDPGLGV